MSSEGNTREEQELPPEAAAGAEEQGSEPATRGANMLRAARCTEDTEHAGDEENNIWSKTRPPPGFYFNL